MACFFLLACLLQMTLAGLNHNRRDYTMGYKCDDVIDCNGLCDEYKTKCLYGHTRDDIDDDASDCVSASGSVKVKDQVCGKKDHNNGVMERPLSWSWSGPVKPIPCKCVSESIAIKCNDRIYVVLSIVFASVAGGLILIFSSVAVGMVYCCGVPAKDDCVKYIWLIFIGISVVFVIVAIVMVSLLASHRSSPFYFYGCGASLGSYHVYT